jgi:surface antigen
MAGPVTGRAFRPPSYSVTAVASLRFAAVVILALSAGGCAVSGQLGSMLAASSKKSAEAGADVTGTARSARRTASAAGVATPSEGDLIFAQSAIVEVLKRGSKDQSAPWENPSSGARGTVTPIASAYLRDGVTCHDFLASYLRQGAETWLQGEACRKQQGQWEVKAIRPWARS